MVLEQVDWMLITELFVDLFFLCDIILNFNTGFIADQVSTVTSLLKWR